MLSTFATFVGQGLWHVWIGYDHLAFLLLLLLPSVLRSTGNAGASTGSFRETARDLLESSPPSRWRTPSPSALAATGTVHVPVRPIEIAIALSIVIAGLLNLFPRAARARLALAFGFGLIHGFGFANALAELGTQGARLVPTLAGFNVGVELAQLTLVLWCCPSCCAPGTPCSIPGASCRPRRLPRRWPAPRPGWAARTAGSSHARQILLNAARRPAPE